MRNLRTTFTVGLTATLIVIMVAPLAAQMQPVAAMPAGAPGTESAPHQVELLVGRSTVLRTLRPIKRVSLPRPEIADALVTSPREVLVHGKTPGTISLLIWGDTGEITTYDVSVSRDLSGLEQQLRQLFPGESIKVSSNGADVVLSGSVSSKYVVDKALALAGGYVEKADNVVNLLQQQEGQASNQILLRVRFAEVSRSAMQELGASFFTGPTGVENTLGRLTTQQFAAPGYDKLEWTKESFDFGADVTGAKGEFTFSDFLNLFLFSEKYDLGMMVRALSSKGLFQSLAEPNLVTTNGVEASFLAGGEYPYPVLQGNNNGVTIMFKEFGVRLKFTPTLVGSDLISLKVAPEVSALDFTNAIVLNGFRVPALSTRRTETQVELRDGQTFAIAGLMDNSLTQTMSKVPGIGDIPILGYLFRSRAYQKNQTELVVMITPQIVKRGSMGVTQELPKLVQPYLGPEGKLLPPPPPAFTPPAAAAAPMNAAEGAALAPVAAAAAVPAPETREERRAREAAEKRAREDERRAREEAEERAREEEKRAREEEKRAREEEERRSKEEARLAKEEAKRAEERAKKQAEEDRRNAEIARKQAEEEAELRAKEEKRLKKLEEQRAEAERKKAEERKKAQQKKSNRRMLSDPWPQLRSRRPW